MDFSWLRIVLLLLAALALQSADGRTQKQSNGKFRLFGHRQRSMAKHEEDRAAGRALTVGVLNRFKALKTIIATTTIIISQGDVIPGPVFVAPVPVPVPITYTPPPVYIPPAPALPPIVNTVITPPPTPTAPLPAPRTLKGSLGRGRAAYDNYDDDDDDDNDDDNLEDDKDRMWSNIPMRQFRGHSDASTDARVRPVSGRQLSQSPQKRSSRERQQKLKRRRTASRRRRMQKQRQQKQRLRKQAAKQKKRLRAKQAQIKHSAQTPKQSGQTAQAAQEDNAEEATTQAAAFNRLVANVKVN